MEYTKNGILLNGELIKLSTIIYNVKKKEVLDDDTVILKIEEPASRHDDGIQESVALDRKRIDRIVEIMLGKEIHFQEVFGKHTYLEFKLDESNYTIDDNVENVTQFLRDHPNGHEYNHSFLHQLAETWDEDEHGSYELQKEFMDLI